MFNFLVLGVLHAEAPERSTGSALGIVRPRSRANKQQSLLLVLSLLLLVLLYVSFDNIN